MPPTPTPPAAALNGQTKNELSPAVYHNVQNYIKELEISEGQLSSVLKNVYENNQKDEFMKRLEEKVKQYDGEIEKLCNANYQSFVSTFNELLNVREDTVQLKDQLVKNNERIQKVGNSLITKVEELIQETKKQNNILLSIEALNKYLPVFNIYRQLKVQMREKKNYYQALKLIDDLEINYLPMVRHYRFSQSIDQSIPLFKEEIKSATITDLKNFLDDLRVQSEKVGKVANMQMAVKLKIDEKYYLLDNELSNPNLNLEGDLKKLPFDVVDFSPLYRNLHMNQVLGFKSYFATYYRDQREKQLNLTLQASSNADPASSEESLDVYKKYFHNVTGFFVIEDQILSSTEGLVDQRYMEKLFEMAMPRLIKIIRRIMEQCVDAELMLKIKIIIVLFCNTIGEVQFPTIQLSDLLKEIREKYYNMLLTKWNDKIKSILNEDNYNCMEIDNSEAYDKLMIVFPCDANSIKSKYVLANQESGSVEAASQSQSGKFFKRMPYSACVPKLFVEMKEFVNYCAKFAEGLNSSQTELDDMVRKPTNRLINDKLSDNIRQLIRNVSLAQLVQIVVNTVYLEKSIELLEQHLLQVICASSSKQSGKLQGSSVFKDLRSEAESRIYDLLNLKIDELLDLESFNWLMTESQGQASDYMKSLLSFLKSNLDTFSQLPSKLGQTACISACKHIAQSLTNQMTNPEKKAMHMGAIEQLNLDLLQCETFASSVQVQGLENETILLCFADVRQLIDLILTKEWSIYLKDYGKADSKYNRVQATTAYNILEKLKEGSKRGKGLLFRLDIGGKASEKDELKLMELTSKQLKALISQTATF